MTLVRKADHMPAGEVGFRHLWGRAKPVELTATAEAEPVALYDPIEPVLPLGLPFVRTVTSEGWFDWPALSDLFPRFLPESSRDEMASSWTRTSTDFAGASPTTSIRT